MTMQTELEKTQLEIAKLQLEQERHKLGQMKKRRKVVDDLGSGAAAVGGVAVKGAGMAAHGGGVLLRYLGRYVGWATFLGVGVCLAYGAAGAWFGQLGPRFGPRIDALMALPGGWGALVTLSAPLLLASVAGSPLQGPWAKHGREVTSMIVIPFFLTLVYRVYF